MGKAQPKRRRAGIAIGPSVISFSAVKSAGSRRWVGPTALLTALIRSPSPSDLFRLHPKLRARYPRVRAPFDSSISFEDYFDFTSGYQDPPFTISGCNIPPPTCNSLQADPCCLSSGSAIPNSASNLHGTSSINWDYALSYSTADASDISPEPTLLSSSASSSVATLTGGLLTPDPCLNNSVDWNAFPLPHPDSHFLGNGTQMLSGGPSAFTTAEDNMNIMAMSSGMAATFSEPMMKSKNTSFTAICS